MRNKVILIFICIFAIALVLGTTYATWVYDNTVSNNSGIEFAVPTWDFTVDSGFAKIENVGSCTNLTASKETSIVSASSEAIRLTNTAGTATKDHLVNISTDRDYTVGEIKYFKVEFDYYYAEKREQAGRGYPSVQLLYNNGKKGANQGGVETVNEKSPFIAAAIDEGWWHLEYYITAMIPTMVDHGDTALSLNQKINGIQINDRSIYDYNSKTAFIIIDNLKFSADLSSRLGLFNRTTTCSVNGYYWVKVAWVGEIQDIAFTFSDDTIAEHDDASTKSPFYIKGLKAGTVVVTVTMVLGEEHQILSISNTITVT